MALCKVTLIGNLGADPEVRFSQAGKQVTKFRVACNNRRRGPDGEWQDHTEWFGVSAFGRQAEVAAELLHKGSRVYVEGRLESRVWESPEGKRFFMDVVLNELQLLDPRQPRDGSDMPAAPRSTGGGSPSQHDEPELDDVPF